MPNHTTRPGTRELDELNEAIVKAGPGGMVSISLDEFNMLLNPMPMRVSGGMQGGPVLGEDKLPMVPYEPSASYVAPGFNPNGQVTQAPPTPNWLVEREEGATVELTEAHLRKALDGIRQYRETAEDRLRADNPLMVVEMNRGAIFPSQSRIAELNEMEERHQTLGTNYTALERAFAAAQLRIVELEARVLEAEDQWSLYAAAAEVEHPKPANDTEKRINDVIDDLSARKVSTPDRARLRGAIDKAEKPLAGRAGQDEGVNNAIGRTSGWRPL